MSTPIRHNKPMQQRSFQPYNLLTPQASLIFPQSNPGTPILNSPLQPANPFLTSNLLQHLQQQQQPQNRLLTEQLAKLAQQESAKILQEHIRHQAQPTVSNMPSDMPISNLLDEATKLMPNVKDPFMLGYITGLLYAQGNINNNSIPMSVENMLISRASSLPNMVQLMMGNTLINTPPEMEEHVIQMPILQPETTSV